MSRSKSSGRWLQEHFDDEYVARAQREGYRSRAVYKLIELDERDGLFSPGMSVVDLGAAPGSWCEYVAQQLGGSGKVIACDLLAMDSIPGVAFIQGDFTESAILESVLAALGDGGADIVISDMAPNMSGVGVVDQPRAMYLAELALSLALDVLSQNGVFLTKVFQGEGFDSFVSNLRSHFTRVVSRKPKASRARSREVYLLARGRKLM